MAQDSTNETRSNKPTLFLQSFEDYIIAVAIGNHGATREEIVMKVKQNLDRSMLASAEYHDNVADICLKDGDIAMSDFHKLQAQIYRSIIGNQSSHSF